MSQSESELALLRWYVAMGADEAIGWLPRGISSEPPPQSSAVVAPAIQSPPPETSLAELEAAVRAFEGCALKRTAT
ncbi:MAG: hypothetical protein ACREE3_15925, partial [Stellaceae bacterium]